MEPLRLGDVILLEGREHIVTLRNESRARCVPTQRRHVLIRDEIRLRNIEFFAIDSSVSISPNSEVELLARLGADGLDRFLGIRPDVATAGTKAFKPNDKTTMKDARTVTDQPVSKDKTKRRGGLAAEGPILEGAPKMAAALPPGLPSGVRYIAVCRDQKRKHADVRVLTTTFIDALRAVGAQHPEGTWIVAATETNGVHDIDAAPQEAPKAKASKPALYANGRPTHPHDEYIWTLLEAGGQSLMAMAKQTAKHFTDLGDVLPKRRARRRIKRAIPAMKAAGLAPKWTANTKADDDDAPTAPPAPLAPPVPAPKARKKAPEAPKASKPAEKLPSKPAHASSAPGNGKTPPAPPARLKSSSKPSKTIVTRKK